MTQNIHTGSIKALIFPLRTCLVQKINKCPAPESFQEDLLFPSLIFIPRTCLLLVCQFCQMEQTSTISWKLDVQHVLNIQLFIKECNLFKMTSNFTWNAFQIQLKCKFIILQKKTKGLHWIFIIIINHCVFFASKTKARK